MPKLLCDAKHCCYHQDSYCCRSNINVKGPEAGTKRETECSSFRKKDRSIDNDIYTSEFATFDTINKNVSVSCSRIKCAHNRNELCCAGSIKIDGETATCPNDTCCNDFRCK